MLHFVLVGGWAAMNGDMLIPLEIGEAAYPFWYVVWIVAAVLIGFAIYRATVKFYYKMGFMDGARAQANNEIK